MAQSVESGLLVQNSETNSKSQALLVRKSELAGRYSVAVRTIDNWMKDQVIPYTKVGATVLFNPGECDEALRKFRRKSRFE